MGRAIFHGKAQRGNGAELSTYADGTIGALDLLLAAHALGLNATLVTNNEKHFRRVSNLTVKNWPQAASDDE